MGIRAFIHRRKEIEHVVGLISVNSVNLNLPEGRGTGREGKPQLDIMRYGSEWRTNCQIRIELEPVEKDPPLPQVSTSRTPGSITVASATRNQSSFKITGE